MTTCKKCGAVEQERVVMEATFRWRKDGPPPGDGWKGPIFPHAQMLSYERPKHQKFFDCKFTCPNQFTKQESM